MATQTLFLSLLVMKLPNGDRAQLGDKLEMAIQEYDVVALTAEVEAVHKETNQPILLKRGQVETILMSFNGEAHLVDFVNSNGKTYAMETIPSNKLMTLTYEPTLTYT